MTNLSTVPTPDSHPLRDSLTKALSRPQFGKCIEDEKQRSDSTALPFVICLIDIDALRNVNDLYGYGVGDVVLAELASRLRSRLDESDLDDIEYLHARFDGDALILLARDCTGKHGRRLATALRAAVNSEPMADGVSITVTIAVVEYQAGESIDSVLGRTEKTMHLAKQFGSDHVELAPTPENTFNSNVVRLPRRAPIRRRRIKHA